MHCIDVKSSEYSNFKESLLNIGVSTEVLSSYVSDGVRWYDVEVSADNRAVDILERGLSA